jgi:transcriptional regulator with XRE-family HTH domain
VYTIMTVKDNVLTNTAGDRVAELTAAVADHVRGLRHARGWSLDELAGRSGVSKGMLVQIEGARSNPSIGTLNRIADAFGVSIARLLQPSTERVVQIVDAAEVPLLWQGTSGGLGRLLRGLGDLDSVVELWEWRLASGEQHESSDHNPRTREVLYVLTGEVVVTVAGDDHRVRAGQVIDFRADRPHGYRNDGDEPARFLMVVALPTQEWDRRGATRPSGAQPTDPR